MTLWIVASLFPAQILGCPQPEALKWWDLSPYLGGPRRPAASQPTSHSPGSPAASQPQPAAATLPGALTHEVSCLKYIKAFNSDVATACWFLIHVPYAAVSFKGVIFRMSTSSLNSSFPSRYNTFSFQLLLRQKSLKLPVWLPVFSVSASSLPSFLAPSPELEGCSPISLS